MLQVHRYDLKGITALKPNANGPSIKGSRVLKLGSHSPATVGWYIGGTACQKVSSLQRPEFEYQKNSVSSSQQLQSGM